MSSQGNTSKIEEQYGVEMVREDRDRVDHSLFLFSFLFLFLSLILRLTYAYCAYLGMLKSITERTWR
jgi:hypothetical protein